MPATTKSRGKRDNPYAFDDLFVTVHRSPVGTAWRWRTELMVLTLFLAALLALSFPFSPASRLAVQLATMARFASCPLWVSYLAWGAAEAAVMAGTLFGIPQTRRFIVRRFWCVLSRHRFHRMCFEGRLHTRAGRVPPVLWVRPTKVGERLIIWVRAGLAAEDFEQHTGELRAACYARDARVTRNVRWSQLMTIDIIRRDTLAANHAPESPFKKLLAERALANLTEPADPVPANADESGSPTWPNATLTKTD